MKKKKNLTFDGNNGHREKGLHALAPKWNIKI